MLMTSVLHSVPRLIMGMMMTTSFLSMWLSNTATTAMMLPIANAILESLFGELETLKENCKCKVDPESEFINGTAYVFFSSSLLTSRLSNQSVIRKIHTKIKLICYFYHTVQLAQF